MHYIDVPTDASIRRNIRENELFGTDPIHPSNWTPAGRTVRTRANLAWEIGTRNATGDLIAVNGGRYLLADRNLFT